MTDLHDFFFKMSGNEFGTGKKNILTKFVPVFSRFEKNRGGVIFTPPPLVHGGLTEYCYIMSTLLHNPLTLHKHKTHNKVDNKYPAHNKMDNKYTAHATHRKWITNTQHTVHSTKWTTNALHTWLWYIHLCKSWLTDCFVFPSPSHVPQPNKTPGYPPAPGQAPAPGNPYSRGGPGYGSSGYPRPSAGYPQWWNVRSIFIFNRVSL